MLRELRTYDCHPGRMPDLLRFFEDHTLAIFDRLIYFLFWEDLAERERRLPLFLADPEWLTARAASEANGPITANVSSRYFTAIAFNKPVNHTK